MLLPSNMNEFIHLHEDYSCSWQFIIDQSLIGDQWRFRLKHRVGQDSHLTLMKFTIRNRLRGSLSKLLQ